MAGMFSWIAGYFGLGACAIVGNFLYLKYFDTSPASPFGGSRLASRPSLTGRVADAIDFVLAFVFAVAVWPLLVVPEIKGRMQRKRFEELASEPRLIANKANLVRRVDCAEVERLETVLDPLGAAPSLPFGHLNSAWQAFKTGLAEGDELWQFSALEPICSVKQAERWTRIAEGYAVVRNGTIVDEFLAHGGLLERSSLHQ